MSNNPDRRGNRGGRRAHRPHTSVSDEKEQRRRAALAEAAEHERRLNRRIEVETAQAEAQARERRAAEEQAEQARKVAEAIEAERARVEAEDAALRRRTDWTLGQARGLVRQGYSVDHAASVTGWDQMWLADAVDEQPTTTDSRSHQ